MYKVFCDKCGHYNYSASRIGNWVCTYCGNELIKNAEQEKQDEKEKKKLA